MSDVQVLQPLVVGGCPGAELDLAGRLPLDDLAARGIPLSQLDDGLAEMRGGRAARSVVTSGD